MLLFCLVFAMSMCTSVYMCFVVTFRERADLCISFVESNCEFVTFPLISWIRCGTCLYRFLIFVPLLTFIRNVRGAFVKVLELSCIYTSIDFCVHFAVDIAVTS